MIPISKPLIGDAEKAAAMEVLESGILAQGPKVAELERQFRELAGTRHAIAVASGTAALHVAVLAHGIGPGDEVITTPFTFIASANCILYAGAKPVFVDVDETTFNIDPAAIEAAVTPRTRAILPVHLYGQPCDLDPIMQIAARHGLAVIEDSAQAVGATYRGQHVGSFGTGTFSLYATKNVMSVEGGIITTNDDEVADRARLLRAHGMRERYYHESLGFNFRLSDLHAAIGIAQMQRLADFTKRRQANAAFLTAGIRTVCTPTVANGREHVWHQYTVRVQPGQRRADALARLTAAGIGTGVFYPVPVHLQGYVRDAIGPVACPVAERLAQEVFSLPVHPGLSPADLETIVREVNEL